MNPRETCPGPLGPVSSPDADPDLGLDTPNLLGPTGTPKTPGTTVWPAVLYTKVWSAFACVLQ